MFKTSYKNNKKPSIVVKVFINRTRNFPGHRFILSETQKMQFEEY